MPKPTGAVVSAAAPTITVFEWVNGGGLSGTPLEQIPVSLVAEGQAMLSTLVRGLSAGGAKLVVPLDVRLFSPRSLQQLSSQAQVIALGEQQQSDWLDRWCQLASRSEWSWLVAPESEDSLRSVADRLRSAGAQLLNADDDFLKAASNKLYCAELLHQAGIAHPATRTLEAIDDAWLSRSANKQTAGETNAEGRPGLWVVKPIDGAGGEGLQIVNRDQLLQLKDSLAAATGASRERRQPRLLVQPWLNGTAVSCSAIVDANGQAHWLPVVSQDFALLKPQGITYLGCTYPAPGIPAAAPAELLRKTLRSLPGRARGWIGIDLLFDPLTRHWWVVEINPRCTSSMVGLASAYAGNLVYDSFRLQTASLAQLSAHFAPVIFRIDQHPSY